MDAPVPRHRGRRAAVVLTAALLVLSGCEAAASPTPSASSLPSPSPSNAVTPPVTASPPQSTQTPGPTVQPLPMPTSNAPAATDAALASLYAALRPVNLRPATGPSTFTRGSDIRLSFEMVNTSGSSVRVPRTAYAGRDGGWLGVIQTWVEPLGSGTDLTRCLPAAARSGARYAMSGMPAAILGGDVTLEPGQGQTQAVFVARNSTACFPAGRYRLTLEYRRIEARSAGDPIAALAVDLQLRNPTAWTTQMAVAGSMSATLALTSDGLRARSSIDLAHLEQGQQYTFEVRAGCQRDGGVIVAPVTFRSAADRAFHDVRTVALSSSVRRALAAGVQPSIWLFYRNSGACIPYLGQPAAVPADRAPTTWGGALLREDLGAGFAVTASSMAYRPGDGQPSHAFDGDVNRTWNSGTGVPGWIELDLGRNTPVNGLRLLPSQLPSPARTLHQVYGRSDGAVTETLLATVDRVTIDNVWLDVPLAKPASIRYVRIQTIVSPSTIAWREIAIGGVQVPHASRMPVGTHDGTTKSLALGAACVAVGWSSDPDSPGDVTVRVLVDGDTAVTGIASQPRPDVAAAGAGDLTSGYQIEIRQYMSLGKPHRIHVQAQDLETGVWVDLAATPRSLTCA